MKLKFLHGLILTLLASGTAMAQNEYGLPENIQDGNILHCFDWKINDVKSSLPDIAKAGFVAVQISPVQRNVPTGKNWSDLYRPADFAFSQSGLGTATNLKSLCEEAEKYGIKVIVDVVFNHVDNGTYHVKWWDSNGRLRTTTSGINYGNRYSITHDRLGDYPEVNSESPEVIARAKAYIEELKEYGVKGIRFDAAKHIALPSEGCDFWKEVCSVPGMFYYGEILNSPGGSNSDQLMKEYSEYMSISDDSYSNTVKNGAGLTSSEGNWSLRGIDPKKIIYWGESHDMYANDPAYASPSSTQKTSQGLIDKAYANLACRESGMALYFSRPSGNTYATIKVGQKGSTHFTDPEVAEVNHFKNAMVGKAQNYSTSNGVTVITRENGGAVLVNRTGAGNVSVANGGGYCPSGTYIDKVSGNQFVVTAETITGQIGETGIAVLYGNEDTGISDIFDNEEFNEEDAAWYTINGIRVNRPDQKGLYIAVSPNGKAKKVLISK